MPPVMMSGRELVPATRLRTTTGKEYGHFFLRPPAEMRKGRRTDRIPVYR